jgi:large conductance mechanosensitive channel
VAVRKTFEEFKSFLLRGNVVELAVAVVVGAAFQDIVKGFVADVITPLIGLVTPGQKGFFGDRAFHIGHGPNYRAVFKYGEFLNTVVTFFFIAAAVFFFVVKPVNHLMERRKTEPAVDNATKSCPECLSNIPLAATRCAFCTSEVPVAS